MEIPIRIRHSDLIAYLRGNSKTTVNSTILNLKEEDPVYRMLFDIIEEVLRKNVSLADFVIHDLNKDPILPFPDQTFDAVINTVSVDYMTKPVEVFQEAGRVLRPGGLFLVVFSNRMFPQKAVKVWKESDEGERVILVEEFFRESALFEKTSLFVSLGKPRPADDKYAGTGIPSDPIYAVYADRIGGDPSRPKRPVVTVSYGESLSEEELNKRKDAIKRTLCCPYCGEKMKKWDVSKNPYESTWDNDFVYMCFNDACPYFVRGWDFMYKQCNRSLSYRLVFDPAEDTCTSIPVYNYQALREGIISKNGDVHDFMPFLKKTTGSNLHIWQNCNACLILTPKPV